MQRLSLPISTRRPIELNIVIKNEKFHLEKIRKRNTENPQVELVCSESGGPAGLRAAGGQDPAEDPTGGNPDPGPVFRLVCN